MHNGIRRGLFSKRLPESKKSGLVKIGIGDWYGGCYLLHMPEPYPTAGHPDDIDLKETAEFDREMAMRSIRITAGEPGLIPPEPSPWEPPKPPDGPPQNPDNPHSFSRKLKFHKEICLYLKCRLCMENCPVTGIGLSVNPPVLIKSCLDFEFCARLCPTGALDMY
jgi:ferredoxin